MMGLKRKSDEGDSTISVVLNYVTVILVTSGIFAVDIMFNKGLLDGTLIGMLIIKAFDALDKQNNYFFPSSRNPKQQNGETENGETQKSA